MNDMVLRIGLEQSYCNEYVHWCTYTITDSSNIRIKPLFITSQASHRRQSLLPEPLCEIQGVNADSCDCGENTAVEVDDQLSLGRCRIVSSPVDSPRFRGISPSETRVCKRPQNTRNLWMCIIGNHFIYHTSRRLLPFSIR